MSDLTPVERLAKLRALQQWLEYQLRETGRRIEQAEQQAARAGDYATEPERRAGRDVGVTIHTRDCPRLRHPAATLTADQAQQALIGDPRFHHPCEHCRPDVTLGTANPGPKLG
ncbi:DUF6233 domain-containing protein [Streptomyces sp. DSM 41014]|uniref:DUF6233 domain-containing protein n=1 Tax=Streptomyces hintoniae TaxID=3075521 RepID=A0ABU2UXA1_9ACTN|nr:DUF6233 domain-containing protein [Streptomyces sp. DSM 41014]MDT0477417.1 DUF6233 domain-containing protein [Streptomyces sp. DSM 41014]